MHLYPAQYFLDFGLVSVDYHCGCVLLIMRSRRQQFAIMNNKKKGGKNKKQGQQEDKKAAAGNATQNKQKGVPENPALGLANMQNELMGKISAMRESLLKGEGGEGLGKEMIDNLFKNLLGDFALPNATVDKQQYLDTEESHQALLSEIDTTLTRRLQ